MDPCFCFIYGGCCFKGKYLISTCQLAGVNDGDVAVSENPSAHLPADGAEWINLFVSEMENATSNDDARARASRLLEILEKSISGRAGAEAAHSFQKVNILFVQFYYYFSWLLKLFRMFLLIKSKE